MYQIVKRVIAVIGIIILLGLYIITFIIAVSGGKHLHDWLIASVAATVAIPGILWVIRYLYQRLRADMDEVNK